MKKETNTQFFQVDIPEGIISFLEKKSGGERLFLHRIRWSRTNLKYAKLLEYPKPGFYKITSRGSKVLEKNPKSIDDSFLSQFMEFRAWRRRK